MVADFLSSDWKLALWLLYLVLNELSVTPMYSAVSSVALYTTDSVRHLFCTGQAVLSLQEHSFSLWSRDPTIYIVVDRAILYNI